MATPDPNSGWTETPLQQSGAQGGPPSVPSPTETAQGGDWSETPIQSPAQDKQKQDAAAAAQQKSQRGGAGGSWTDSKVPETDNAIAKHGLLRRAWDYANTPIADFVLPEGVKSSDILKATAFEHLYKEAYIPGKNDFETKAQQHFGDAKGKGADSPSKAALKTFLNGVAGDTATTVAGFSSPLSLATMGAGALGKVPGAAGTLGKAASTMAGTAFAGQGIYQTEEGIRQALKTGFHSEELSNIAGGLGQTILGGAGVGENAHNFREGVGNAIKTGVTPELQPTSSGAQIPVRNTSRLGNLAAQSVDENIPARTVEQQTAPAVAKAIGTVAARASEAGGKYGAYNGVFQTPEEATVPTPGDRFGLKGHADNLYKNQAKPVYDALDEASDGAFTKAQNDTEKYKYTDADKYDAAQEKKQSIIDENRERLKQQGLDPDAADAAYRKKVALEKMSAKLEQATGPSTVDGTDYALSGKKLAKAIDDMVKKGDRSPLARAGFTSDHVAQIQELANVLKDQENIPRIGTFMKGMGKGIITLAGLGHGGIVGAAEALTGESMVEKVGQKVANGVFGQAMTDPAVARDLTAGMKSGDPQSFLDKVKSAPWFQNMKDTATRLWTEEQGEAGKPGTVGGNKAATRKLPTGDQLISKYGESDGDPAHTAFLLPDGRGVAHTGTIHDEMLGGKTTDVPAPRERFINEQGGIRMRSHGVYGNRQFAISIPKEGITPEQLNALKKMSPQMGTGSVYIETPGGETRTVDYGKASSELESKIREIVPIKGEQPPSSVSPKQSADNFNATKGRGPVQEVTAEAHQQGKQIADAYDAMKHDPENPAVKASYDSLKKGIDDQWNHAQADGFKFEPWDKEGQPYANSKEMKADVDNNKHLYFFRGGDMPADHPLAEMDQKTGLTYNDKLRAIHDLYGHAATGAEFGPKGEEQAYKTHAQMFDKDAIPALTSETRGQNNWVNNGAHLRDETGNVPKKGEAGFVSPKDRPFAEQKAGILPSEFHGDTPSKLNPEYSTSASGMHEVKTAGGGYLSAQDTEVPGEAQVKAHMVPEELRGRGVGMSQLETMAKGLAEDPAKRTLLSDDDMTEAAGGAWRKLQAKYPQAVSEYEGANGEPRYRFDLSKLRPEDATQHEVGTMRPYGANAEDLHDPSKIVGGQTIEDLANKNPKFAEKLAASLSKYRGLSLDEADYHDPHRIINKFVDSMSDNLRWLHGEIPDSIKDTARNWYKSANTSIVKPWAAQYGYEPRQIAGAVAALSPQNPWENNVGTVKTILDTVKDKQNHEWTDNMESQGLDLSKGAPELRKIYKAIRGKTLGELHEPVEQAMWIRLLDETEGSGKNDVYDPNGNVKGVDDRARAWSSIDTIAKALRILDDGSMQSIHENLGFGHKVRNFYNNLINPDSKNGHVTIDTHAVAAAHAQPLGGLDPEVGHNFGSSPRGIPGVPKNAGAGLKSSAYPLYAEAYRRVAKELGMPVHELQSSVWEGARSLFGDKKGPEVGLVKGIWQDYKDGKIGLDKARQKTIELSGGFKKPNWMSQEDWDKSQGTDFDFGGSNE